MPSKLRASISVARRIIGYKMDAVYYRGAYYAELGESNELRAAVARQLLMIAGLRTELAEARRAAKPQVHVGHLNVTTAAQGVDREGLAQYAATTR